MRLLMAGDTHGDYQHFDKLIKWAKKMDCEAIVQLGDFGFIWRKPKSNSFYSSPGAPVPEVLVDKERPVHVLSEKLERAGILGFFLDGNHEDYDQLSDLANIYFGDPTKKIAEVHAWNSHDDPIPLSPWLTYLPRSSTWEWDGVKFMALGGAVSVDRSRRVKHVSWWPQETIKTWDVHRALQRPEVDIMLTHDFPQGVPTMMEAMANGPWHLNAKLEGESATNRIYIETVRAHHHPIGLFHGHMHHDYVDLWNGTKVRGINCNKTGNRSWWVFDTEEFHQGILR